MDPRPSLVPVALAIAFAGVVIALAIYFVLRPPEQTALGIGGREVEVEEINASDHVLGNPSAPIVVIEYSDLDCPYCRSFHATMKAIMSVYGESGQVAWVYRHFPIVELHPNAPRLAEASECVAEIGGNQAFWKFVDAVFTAPAANGRFDMGQLEATAAVAGVPVGPFQTCLDSGRHRETVNREFEEAVAAGGEGTPHNIIFSPSAPPLPVPGAQPYSTIKSIIDSLLLGTSL